MAWIFTNEFPMDFFIPRHCFFHPPKSNMETPKSMISIYVFPTGLFCQISFQEKNSKANHFF